MGQQGGQLIESLTRGQSKLPRMRLGLLEHNCDKSKMYKTSRDLPWGISTCWMLAIDLELNIVSIDLG